MSDDEDEDQDYGFINEDEDIEYDSLDDVIESGDVDVILNYIKTSNINVTNDTYDNILKVINKYDLVKKIYSSILSKKQIKPTHKSLNYAVKTGDVQIFKFTNEICGKNNIICNIDRDYVNDFIKLGKTDQRIHNMFKTKITKCSDESLNFAILYSTDLKFIEYIHEKGGKILDNTLQYAIESNNVAILNYIITFLPQANKYTMMQAINNAISNAGKVNNENGLLIIKEIQNYTKKSLNETEIELFLTRFTEEDIIKYGIKYNITLIPNIPKYKTYCKIKLGLTELRQILKDCNIDSINDKHIDKLSKQEICKYLDDDNEIYSMVINNKLLRCSNITSRRNRLLTVDHDLIARNDDVNVMTDCIIESDLGYLHSSDVDLADYEISKKLKKFLLHKPNTPKSVHVNYLTGDDVYYENIKDIFSILHQYVNQVNLDLYNRYIQLNNDEFNDFIVDVVQNLNLNLADFDNLRNNTIENKSKILDVITDNKTNEDIFGHLAHMLVLLQVFDD